MYQLGLQLAPGDKRVLKRMWPLGTTGLSTIGTEVAASAVAGDACLHVPEIQCEVCVRYSMCVDVYQVHCSVHAETLQPADMNGI